MEVDIGDQNCTKNWVQLKMCSACNVKADNTRVAPYFVCAYFSLETNKFRRVCQKCCQEAQTHQNVLVNMLYEHKSLASGPKKLKNEIEIVDLDEDAEPHDETDECREEVEITEDVEELVELLMEKYQFSKQLHDTAIHLSNKDLINFLKNNLMMNQIFVFLYLFAGNKSTVAKEEVAMLEVSTSRLENNISALRRELFQPYEPIICYVDSVDIDEDGNVSKHSTTLSSSPVILPPLPTSRITTELPPVGEFIYKPIKLHQTIYAMKTSLLKPWVKGTVMKVSINDSYLLIFLLCF